MRAALVRVGIDQAYGGWNAPVDPDTGEFVYVPIPEGSVEQCAKLATTYDSVEPALREFAIAKGLLETKDCSLPRNLVGASTHLDPDFSQLTYGDNGERRGRGIAGFEPGDAIAFYAGLNPIRPCGHKLIYALIGLYRVAEVVRAGDVPESRWSENAHLRRREIRSTDVIVRADPGRSGRLRRALPIGEYRDRAYRVTKPLLNEWGGLSCKDGFIQRSAVPPLFLEPERFLRWFDRQRPDLVASNI